MPVAQAGRRPVDRTLKSVCRLSEYGLENRLGMSGFSRSRRSQKNEWNSSRIHPFVRTDVRALLPGFPGCPKGFTLHIRGGL